MLINCPNTTLMSSNFDCRIESVAIVVPILWAVMATISMRITLPQNATHQRNGGFLPVDNLSINSIVLDDCCRNAWLQQHSTIYPAVIVRVLDCG